jgi:hypothetical protein
MLLQRNNKYEAIFKQIKAKLKSPKLRHSSTPELQNTLAHKPTPRMIKLISEESPRQFTSPSVY